MENNLQAKELNRLYKAIPNMVSEEIELENLEHLKPTNWVAIDSKTINFYYLSSNQLIAKSKLEVFGEYLYLNSKPIKPKKIKKSSKKSIIRLQFILNRTLRVGRYAIDRLPTDVTLEGQNFKAVANLHFRDRFVLEIKEIL